MYGIFYYILYFPEGTITLNGCPFIVTNTTYIFLSVRSSKLFSQ